MRIYKDKRMRRMVNIGRWMVAVGLIVWIQAATLALAEENKADEVPFHGGIHAGFSMYTGVLGVELTQGHWGFSMGMPVAIGVKYYSDKEGYRWFAGAHGMYQHVEDKTTEDGIRYDEQTYGYAGLGLGYKWRFKFHWDLCLSLSTVYYRRLLENDTESRRDDYVSLFPGLTLGYTF